MACPGGSWEVERRARIWTGGASAVGQMSITACRLLVRTSEERGQGFVQVLG